MKKLLYILSLFYLASCSNKNADTDIIEREIIKQTIYKLTPNLNDVALIVPAEGGESSEVYEKRESEFWLEHNEKRKNGSLNIILSNILNVPANGERYTSPKGLSNEFVHFLYDNNLKTKLINCSEIKSINGIKVINRKIDHENYQSANKPGCYGYVEYTRMYIHKNHLTASFIYKYRLNNGENRSYFITVKKKNDIWNIVKKEEIEVYYQDPSTSIQPTNIIDTIQVPDHNEKDFKIEIVVNNVSMDKYPKNKEILFKFKNESFKESFLKYADLYLAVNGYGDNDKYIHFKEIKNDLYSLKVDSGYSERFLEYGVCLTPKRGYVLKKMHQTGSMMYVTNTEQLRIEMDIIEIEQ
ncbi:hypothetical protein D3C87_27290 [compost metagenome]